MSAFAPQQQKTDDRDVIESCDLGAAMGTPGAGRREIEARTCLEGLTTQLRRLFRPLPFEHDREAMNDDVQEAADKKAEKSAEKRNSDWVIDIQSTNTSG